MRQRAILVLTFAACTIAVAGTLLILIMIISSYATWPEH